MAHDFADLIRDLEAAKSDLARTVKRCRTSLGDSSAKPATPGGRSAFDWSDRQGR
jgi:hypothetical protein